MKKFAKRRFFTLVELLVSLGVFSILLIIFMQLFSNLRLVVSNSEMRTSTTTESRSAMDLFSTMLSTLYYSTANTYSVGGVNEIGYFPFQLVRGGANDSTDRLYFATKAQIDLAGTSPIRYVGFIVPNRANSLAGADFYDKLYLTVLSNKEGANNAEIYRQLFPQFVNSSGGLVTLSVAVNVLTTNLNGKLTDHTDPDTDTENRIKLLDNVVDFKVRLLKEDGNAESGNVITSATRQIEIVVSILADKDYQEWVKLYGTGTNESDEAKKFRALTQTTFTRRIYIGDRSLLEDTYE